MNHGRRSAASTFFNSLLDGAPRRLLTVAGSKRDCWIQALGGYQFEDEDLAAVTQYTPAGRRAALQSKY